MEHIFSAEYKDERQQIFVAFFAQNDSIEFPIGEGEGQESVQVPGVPSVAEQGHHRDAHCRRQETDRIARFRGIGSEA